MQRRIYMKKSLVADMVLFIYIIPVSAIAAQDGIQNTAAGQFGITGNPLAYTGFGSYVLYGRN
jgi:hypothetical protein